MKPITGSLFLLITASFGTQLYAQQQMDVPSFVFLTTRGTEIANRCADNVNRVLTAKVPADHAAARAAMAANEGVQGARRMVISPENENYMRHINESKGSVSTCGRQLASVRGPIQANIKRFSELIASDKLPRADAQKVATAISAYNDAQKRLVNAILALSKDPQVESHMGEVITKDFIEEAKK